MSNIRIQKISVTKLHTDAIVNAANEGLWEGGGVCGAIFREAGSKELRKACEAIGGCRTGSAVITPGFALPAKYIIHAVGPRWSGGERNEPELLYSAYERSLLLAKEKDCGTIIEESGISERDLRHPSKEWAASLSKDQILACIAWHFRRDHFAEGSWENDSVANGHMLELVRGYLAKQDKSNIDI